MLKGTVHTKLHQIEGKAQFNDRESPVTNKLKQDLKITNFNKNLENYMNSQTAPQTSSSSTHRTSKQLQSLQYSEKSPDTNSGRLATNKEKNNDKHLLMESIPDKGKIRINNYMNNHDENQQGLEFTKSSAIVDTQQHFAAPSYSNYKQIFKNNMGYGEKPLFNKHSFSKKEFLQQSSSTTPTTSMHQSQSQSNVQSQTIKHTYSSPNGFVEASPNTTHKKTIDYQSDIPITDKYRNKDNISEKDSTLEYFRNYSGGVIDQPTLKKTFNRTASYASVSSGNNYNGIEVTKQIKYKEVGRKKAGSSVYLDENNEECMKHAINKNTKTSFSPCIESFKGRSNDLKQNIIAQSSYKEQNEHETQSVAKIAKRSSSNVPVEKEKKGKREILLGSTDFMGVNYSRQPPFTTSASMSHQISIENFNHADQIQMLKSLYQKKRKENLEYFKLGKGEGKEKKHIKTSAPGSLKLHNQNCFVDGKMHFSSQEMLPRYDKEVLGHRSTNTPDSKAHEAKKNFQLYLPLDHKYQSRRESQPSHASTQSVRGIEKFTLSTRSAADSHEVRDDIGIYRSKQGSPTEQGLKKLKESNSEKYCLLNGLLKNGIIDQLKNNPNAKFLTLRKQIQEKRKGKWEHGSVDHTSKFKSNESHHGSIEEPIKPNLDKHSNQASTHKQKEQNLLTIFERTKAVLNSYKKKEKKWNHEKAMLMREIHNLRTQLGVTPEPALKSQPYQNNKRYSNNTHDYNE